MGKNGWCFWVSQGDWRDVLYVGESDFEAASKLAEAKAGKAKIDKFHEIPAGVREFLNLTDGRVIRAHVMDR